MIPRFGILLLFLLCLSVPASGVNFYQLPDDSLTAAASKMKGKEYEEAMETALKAPAGGIKDFLLGMAAARLGKWESSAEYQAA